MYRTLRISFSLKNTYRVNSILYAVKQIPLIKKILPDALYGVKGLKIFANVLSAAGEVLSVFLGKFLYLAIMIRGIGELYKEVPGDQVFLHILLFLTVIGAYMNTSLFEPTRDKYYAMILMRMNAREYTLVNYGYTILKVILGFLPFSIYFGTLQGIPFWFCLLIPFSIAGVKLAVSAFSLRNYEKNGFVYKEGKIRKHLWLFVLIFLVLAYGLPAAGIVLPEEASMLILAAFISAGLSGIRKIYSFSYYREINQELLARMMYQMDTIQQAAKTANEKTISSDTHITSRKKGFEYLNELFIKRHQKILWRSTVKITAACFVLVWGMLLALCFVPEIRESANELVLNWLPYFVFIMYTINRGRNFTRVLFMNCDHSLLTYSIYKQPKFVLKLFQIRLREIMKINAVPAIVIGAGLCLTLCASGGTENPAHYLVLFISILCMSIFFSIHYLTIYYLLQPYNAGTEMKSGTYQMVMSGTYLVCLGMMQVKMPTLLFGITCILFCILYSAAACILVYKFAPKTFRLRT